MAPRLTVSGHTVDVSTLGAAGSILETPSVIPKTAIRTTTVMTIRFRRRRFFTYSSRTISIALRSRAQVLLMQVNCHYGLGLLQPVGVMGSDTDMEGECPKGPESGRPRSARCHIWVYFSIGLRDHSRKYLLPPVVNKQGAERQEPSALSEAILQVFMFFKCLLKRRRALRQRLYPARSGQLLAKLNTTL